MSSEFIQLLTELEKATDKNAVKWEEVLGGQGFRVILASGIVRIEETQDYDEDGQLDGERYLAAVLLNRHGQLLERVTSNDTEGDIELLGRLYSKARKNALKPNTVQSGW